MSRLSFWIGVCVLVLGSIAAIGWVAADFFDHTELGAEKYYAALQQVEYENRGRSLKGVVIQKSNDGSQLSMMGIPTRDSTYPRVWLALNKTGPGDGVLAVPGNVAPNIRCDELPRIFSQNRVVKPVEDYLLKVCLNS